MFDKFIQFTIDAIVALAAFSFWAVVFLLTMIVIDGLYNAIKKD